MNFNFQENLKQIFQILKKLIFPLNLFTMDPGHKFLGLRVGLPGAAAWMNKKMGKVVLKK